MYSSIALFAPYNLGVNIMAFHIVKALASPPLNIIMSYIGKSFLLVIPLLVIYLYLKKDKNVYSLIVAGIVLYLLSDVIKNLVGEVRPCNITALSWINQVSCENTFSFPSNHASVLTGLPLFMGKYRILQALYIIWLILVLFGRVYLGLHYFTDVVAGIALSLVVSYIVYVYRSRINGFLNGIVMKIVPFLAIK